SLRRSPGCVGRSAGSADGSTPGSPTVGTGHSAPCAVRARDDRFRDTFHDGAAEGRALLGLRNFAPEEPEPQQLGSAGSARISRESCSTLRCARPILPGAAGAPALWRISTPLPTPNRP